MGKKVGIDLGTTYSCVAYLNEDGGLEVLKNAEDSNTTPSLVFFENESNVIVGAPARAGSIYNPENLIERVKSYMGDPNYTINKFGVDYSPSAISSLILRKLKKDAEAALGDTIDGAVITCPAYFGTEARAATKKAGEDAGLNVLQIINEPTAAAYAYAYVKGTDINKTVLVYDLGGGTFDVTLLKMDFAGDKKDLTVLASNGDHTLGGKDWDARLTNLVINKFCDATGVDPDEMREDTDMIGWFSENTENNKQKLSHLETVKFGINFNGTKNLVEVSRDEFEAETEDLLAKTIDLVNATLADKNMTIDQIDEIILVGGSTYMPQVSKRLEAEYGKPLVSFEPNEAVAKGAAIMAQVRAASEDTSEVSQQIVSLVANEVPEVHDITTKSYGIKVYNPNTTKLETINLVKKGTTMPCSGCNNDIPSLSGLTLGGATSITICECDQIEDIVDFDVTKDIYTGPLNVQPGLSPDTEVEVHLDVNNSGVLQIRVTINGVETYLEFDPAKNEAFVSGNEEAKKLNLC